MDRMNIIQKIKEEKVIYKMVADDGYEFSDDYPDIDKAERRAIYLTMHNASVQTIFIVCQKVYIEYTKYDCIDKPILTRKDEICSIVREVKLGMTRIII